LNHGNVLVTPHESKLIFTMTLPPVHTTEGGRPICTG
jgi:hypothetical protein